MTAELYTPRMRLRPFAPDDVELLVALDADPGVKRYIDGGLPVDRDEVVAMLDSWLGFPERSPGHGFWAAEDRTTGEFLGFHLRPKPDDPVDQPELGYRLHRAVWGRGLATGRAALAAPYALERRRVRRRRALVRMGRRAGG